MRIRNLAANTPAERLRRQARARTGERHDKEQGNANSYSQGKYTAKFHDLYPFVLGSIADGIRAAVAARRS
jgi:hypothetical protein